MGVISLTFQLLTSTLKLAFLCSYLVPLLSSPNPSDTVCVHPSLCILVHILFPLKNLLCSSLYLGRYYQVYPDSGLCSALTLPEIEQK